jgi:nucleotide-binding universal stress UspA family protein
LDSSVVTSEAPQGPLVLCFDGSEAAEHALRTAPVLLGRDAGFDAQALLLEADRPTAELIAAKAEELDAPAIVMGQRGLSGLKSALLGSVTRDVVNAQHRPVVLV